MMKQKTINKLFYFFLTVLILPNIIQIYTEGLGLWGNMVNIIAPVAFYILALTVGRRIGRTVIILFPILFLGAFQLVLTYLYGRGPIAVDMWLNLVTTNGDEVGELLSQLLPAIGWVVVIYVPTIILAITLWTKKRDLDHTFVKHWRKSGFIMAVAAILLTTTVTISTDFIPTNSIFPLNACYNCTLAFGREKASAEYHKTSDHFTFNAKSTIDPTDTTRQTIVCVVGETSRSDNWQLYGYHRPTNPLLTKQQGLTVFSNYMSQSNTTHKSVPILLSLASAEDFNILFSTKGIMQAFREAGWHTAYISNQQRNHSFIDFLGEQADDCIFLHDTANGGSKAMTTDSDVLTPLRKQLAKDYHKLFVVVHTYGSHFDYADRYPKLMAHFLPDSYNGAKPQYRQMMVNAYDNSIRFTDWLLHRIIRLAQQRGGATAMLFTSDHGEDIFDDSRKLFLHASPYPSFYQLHVPMVIWTSEVYTKQFPNEADALHRNSQLPASSNCVFHTLLTLGHVATTYRNDTLSLASRRFMPQQKRFFLDDHNTPRTYEECMQETDIRLLKLKHIIK